MCGVCGVCVCGVCVRCVQERIRCYIGVQLHVWLRQAVIVAIVAVPGCQLHQTMWGAAAFWLCQADSFLKQCGVQLHCGCARLSACWNNVGCSYIMAVPG